MSLEGSQIGSYRLLRLIGSGGTGEVYLAGDALKQHVAIKVWRTDATLGLQEGDTSCLFQHEASTIAHMDHPSILPLLSYGEEQVNGATVSYIVMPYCKDGSLVTWLRQRGNDELLTAQEIVTLITQTADALNYAHNHTILHLNMKPTNLLLRNHDNASAIPDVFVSGFSITGPDKEISRITRSTAAYMAPEQWNGQPVPASDQYALAAITYFLLTGRHPFRGDMEQVKYQHLYTMPQPPGAFNPHLSTAIDMVILRALDKSPPNRFPSVSTFAHAFHKEQATQTAFTFREMVNIPSFAPDVPYPYTERTAFSNAPLQVSPVPAARTTLSPTSKAPRRRSGKIAAIAILVIALLLILSSGAIFAVNTISANQANATGTAIASAATAHINATNTEQTNLNATAFAQSNVDATSTSVAVAQATTTFDRQHPNPYPPHTGTLAVYDPLNGNVPSNWNAFNDPGESCQFSNGSYLVSVAKANYMYYCYEGMAFSNFTFEVQMRITQGDCGGITFRLNNDANEMYLLQICHDSSAGLYTLIKGTYTNLVNPQFSALVHQGIGVTNTLAVVANGSSITVYINHNLFGSATDKHFTSGDIALMADYYTNATDVAFNNARVWTL